MDVITRLYFARDGKENGMRGTHPILTLRKKSENLDVSNALP
jgi:hypothetical protein